MVGIARSKACAGCRARRKKCDEVRPECGLCIKRGIECVYKDGLNIVLVDPASRSRYRSSSRSSSGSPWSSSSSVQSTATPQDLPQTCLVTSYRLQMNSVFLGSYLPGSRGPFGLPTDSRPNVSTLWLSTTYELSLTDHLLSDALSALSLSYIERQDGFDGTLHRSQAMYGRAMRALSMKLMDQDEVSQDATLAAAMALTAYELQNASKAGVPGWLSHVKGASRLVQLRGSKNVATNFGQQLFLGTRLTDFIADIGKRKAIEPHALSFPNTFTGPLSSFAKLFDILQTVPFILEQSDNIMASLQGSSEVELASKITIMSYTCQDFESRLTSWRGQLGREKAVDNQEQLYWEEPSTLYHTLPVDSSARIFPMFFCFQNLDIAQQLVLYWTGLMFMHISQYRSEQGVRHRDADLPSLYSTDVERAAVPAKCMELAIDITKSLEYLVHPDMGLTALNFLGLPVNLVFGYLTQRGAKERFWFNVIFDRLSAMSSGFGEFMKAMAYQGGGGKAFNQLVLQRNYDPAKPQDGT